MSHSVSDGELFAQKLPQTCWLCHGRHLPTLLYGVTYTIPSYGNKTASNSFLDFGTLHVRVVSVPCSHHAEHRDMQKPTAGIGGR